MVDRPNGVHLHAGVMFIVNAKDGACTSYYNDNPRFEHDDESLLSRLPLRFLDSLKYFGQYNVAEPKGTGPVLTVMAIHWCFGVDWEKIAVHDGSILYKLHTDEV